MEASYLLLFKGSECLVMSVNCNASSPDFTVVLFYRPPNSGHVPLDNLFPTLCNDYDNSLGNKGSKRSHALVERSWSTCQQVRLERFERLQHED